MRVSNGNQALGQPYIELEADMSAFAGRSTRD
jgi:hypothetical protein